jgi:hypothetical protein
MKNVLMRVTLLLAVSGISCWADAMHGYCAGVGQCVDNGTNSPTNINPPSNFGFTVSPGPATGSTLLIDVLEPNNAAHAPVTITGTYSGTATLFSATPWTSGNLDAFLKISASPNDPIGAFIPDPADLGAAGFFIYQLAIAPVGGVTLQGPGNPNVSPLENIVGSLPLGAYIVGFLNEGTAGAPNWIATANSGAILEDAVPEPTSIILLGTVVIGLMGVCRKRLQRNA